MSVLYPDNPKRRARVHQLVDDLHDQLSATRVDLAAFRAGSAGATRKLQAVYATAGLGAPAVTTMQILSVTDTARHGKEVSDDVELAEILVDAGAVAAPSVFGTAAAADMAEAGLISGEAAEAAISTTLGAEITAGGMFGGIVGVLVAGAVAGGITLVMSAASGAAEATELRGAIARAKTLREKGALTALRAEAMVALVAAVSKACDAVLPMLTGSERQQFVDNTIRGKVDPEMRALAAIDRKAAVVAMYRLDLAHGAWMAEG